MRLLAFVAILLLLCGCKSEEPASNDNNRVSFAKSSYTFGVVDNEEWFEIPVVATEAMHSNQNIGVEVVAAESSAIVVKLNLLFNDNKATTATITLQRCCEFDINNFEGYAVVTSTWSMQYMNRDSHLVHTYANKSEEGVVVIEDMFYEDYDIRVKMHNNDRLNPLATLCGAQVLGTTGEAFGTIYGNGKLMMGAAPDEYLSYYSTCENFLLLYTEMYVEEVGTVGYFGHILEWISDDEAERIMREGL